MKKYTGFVTILCFVLGMCSLAYAHKVNIFAYADGGMIYTESGYSRSQRVQNGTIEVRVATSQELLLTGNTDTHGKFSFPIPQRVLEEHLNLDLIVLAGQGHKGIWHIAYSELGASGIGAAKKKTQAKTIPAAGSVAAEDLDSMVREAVREEVSGLKQMVAKMQNQDPGFKEVAAGFGYLVGIAGFIAYLRSRRSSR